MLAFAVRCSSHQNTMLVYTVLYYTAQRQHVRLNVQ